MFVLSVFVSLSVCDFVLSESESSLVKVASGFDYLFISVASTKGKKKSLKSENKNSQTCHRPHWKLNFFFF